MKLRYSKIIPLADSAIDVKNVFIEIPPFLRWRLRGDVEVSALASINILYRHQARLLYIV